MKNLSRYHAAKKSFWNTNIIHMFLKNINLSWKIAISISYLSVAVHVAVFTLLKFRGSILSQANFWCWDFDKTNLMELTDWRKSYFKDILISVSVFGCLSWIMPTMPMRITTILIDSARRPTNIADFFYQEKFYQTIVIVHQRIFKPRIT